MKRKGLHKPTIEDAIETSGIELLHPGGFELTQRTAELCKLEKGMNVLDVSSGRGTLAIYYAQNYGVHVTGIDISKEMVDSATRKAIENNLSDEVNFIRGDSQNLPFNDNMFDVVINECAVGIPDDSQKVLNEMVRVVKNEGAIAIHESIFQVKLSQHERDEISERYGTTPLEFEEWEEMLRIAGTEHIIAETENWSKPEMFWNVRKDRKVIDPKKTLSGMEKTITAFRIFRKYGIKGIVKAYKNKTYFINLINSGILGYALYKGIKSPAANNGEHP